jgi:hypothetical protein
MLTADEQVDAVYHIIGDALRDTPALEGGFPLPEFRASLERVLLDRKPSAGSLPWLLLPIFAYEAASGQEPGDDLRRAQQVAAALEIGRIAAGCLDEWQDQDTDDALWLALGAARAVNLATALIPLSFLVLGCLADLGAEASLILGLHEEFHRTLLRMCAGQDADLAEELTLENYEPVAGAKSGSLFRLGCRVGAMVAGASPAEVTRYGDLGYNLGVVAQMWNDLEGLAGTRGKADADRQRSLPILARQAFEEMRPGPALEGEPVGPLYALVQLQVYHRRAAEALAQCPAAGRLRLYLDAYAPRHLVEKVQQAVSQRQEDHAR